MKPDRPHIALCADPIEAAGLLDLVNGSQSLSPGLSTLLTPGHTAGHQSVLIASGDEKAIILGDASHSAVQLIHPDWAPRFDADPELSTRTRFELFERIEQEGLTIAAGHYPYPGLGGIVRVEGKRRWRPLRRRFEATVGREVACELAGCPQTGLRWCSVPTGASNA
jgi:glyoxylase-like metal-dependent hydrolase (beta-lactamase superfamily II)